MTRASTEKYNFSEPSEETSAWWLAHGTTMEARCATEVWRKAKAYNGIGLCMDICLDLARVTIRAMREPTARMVLDGYGAGGPVQDLEGTERTWRAMIDAASPLDDTPASGA